MPAWCAASGCPRLIGFPADSDLAGRMQQAGQRAQELALAVAGDAGDADDLAAARGQAHVVEGRRRTTS